MNAVAIIAPSNEDNTMPSTAAASIDWRPLSAVPDDRKDGRDVLLWVGGYAAVCAYDLDFWWDSVGRVVTGATHFADVEGPGA